MSCWIIRNLKNSNDSKIVKYYLIIDNNIIQTLKLLSIFMFNQKLHPVTHTYLSDCITSNDKDDLMNWQLSYWCILQVINFFAIPGEGRAEQSDKYDYTSFCNEISHALQKKTGDRLRVLTVESRLAHSKGLIWTWKALFHCKKLYLFWVNECVLSFEFSSISTTGKDTICRVLELLYDSNIIP